MGICCGRICGKFHGEEITADAIVQVENLDPVDDVVTAIMRAQKTWLADKGYKHSAGRAHLQFQVEVEGKGKLMVFGPEDPAEDRKIAASIPKVSIWMTSPAPISKVPTENDFESDFFEMDEDKKLVMKWKPLAKVTKPSFTSNTRTWSPEGHTPFIKKGGSDYSYVKPYAEMPTAVTSTHSDGDQKTWLQKEVNADVDGY